MLAMKTDIAGKGDYLLIEDEKSKRKMIVQIYDEEYLSSQSLIEDIVKDEVVIASVQKIYMIRSTLESYQG